MRYVGSLEDRREKFDESHHVRLLSRDLTALDLLPRCTNVEDSEREATAKLQAMAGSSACPSFVRSCEMYHSCTLEPQPQGTVAHPLIPKIQF